MAMYIGESVRTSLEEVKAHPLRSLFTLVGWTTEGGAPVPGGALPI